MSNTAKKVGALVGCAMLASGAMAAPAVAAEPGTLCGEAAIQDVLQETAVVNGLTAVSNVAGTFSYTQDSLSSNGYISNVFSKAAATLCSSLPDYAIRNVEENLVIRGADGAAWTVPEQTLENESAAKIIGCSCASNAPGGGATVQAEVSGISLEDLVTLARSR